MFVHLADYLGCHLVLEDDGPRRQTGVAHLLEVEDALLGDVAGIDADADLVGLGVGAHDA